MIATKAAEREMQNAHHTELWTRACHAGQRAAIACKPTPMIVEQHANQADDASPVVKSYHVPGGVCGFAEINVRPGTSSFAHWLKRNVARASKAYYGGIRVPIMTYGQSYETKCAHAEAAVSVLREAGIRATVNSRLD